MWILLETPASVRNNLVLSILLLTGLAGDASSNTPIFVAVGVGGGVGPLGAKYQEELLKLYPTWYAPLADTGPVAIDLGSAAQNGSYVGAYAQSQDGLLFESLRKGTKFGAAPHTGSVYVGTSSSWNNPAASKLSYAFWMKCAPTTGAGYWPLVTIFDECCAWFFVDVNTTNEVGRFYVASNNPSWSTGPHGTTPLCNNSRRFVAMAWQTSGNTYTLKAWVDGVIEINESGSGASGPDTIPMQNAPLMVAGYYGVNQQAWNTSSGGVTLQEVAFWSNYELTSADVTRLWNVGSKGSP